MLYRDVNNIAVITTAAFISASRICRDYRHINHIGYFIPKIIIMELPTPSCYYQDETPITCRYYCHQLCCSVLEYYQLPQLPTPQTITAPSDHCHTTTSITIQHSTATAGEFTKPRFACGRWCLCTHSRTLTPLARAAKYHLHCPSHSGEPTGCRRWRHGVHCQGGPPPQNIPSPRGGDAVALTCHLGQQRTALRQPLLV